jgi:hypothetical protein
MGRASATPDGVTVLVEIVGALQPVNLAPLALGRAAGTRFTLAAGGLRGRRGRRREVLIEQPRHLSGTTALGNPITLRIRTLRSSATVTTSPGRTGRLDVSMRAPLMRTRPASDSAAAAERVRTTRACHSHLSIR